MLSTEGKLVSKNCNISNSGKGSINLYHAGGINLRVRPRLEKKKVLLFKIIGESLEIPAFPVSGIYKCTSYYTPKQKPIKLQVRL